VTEQYQAQAAISFEEFDVDKDAERVFTTQIRLHFQPPFQFFVVRESDMPTVHLALPPDPNMTEEQLEAVSAGLCCCW